MEHVLEKLLGTVIGVQNYKKVELAERDNSSLAVEGLERFKLKRNPLRNTVLHTTTLFRLAKPYPWYQTIRDL